MSEVVIMHREMTAIGKVEHLISLVPHETLLSTISRIRPRSGDEIVIKVMDDELPPNKLADEIITDMILYHNQEEQRQTILSPDAISEPDPLK